MSLEFQDLKRGELPASEVAAWLHVAGDGQVTVYTGKVEIGQNVRTSLAQGVAEELSRPLRVRVRLVMGDTAQVPDDVGTFGSLSTPVMFAQLRRASASAREYLLDEAASLWQSREQNSLRSLEWSGTEPSGRTISYGELTQGRELIKAVADKPALTPEAEWSVAGNFLPQGQRRGPCDGAASVRLRPEKPRDATWKGAAFPRLRTEARFARRHQSRRLGLRFEW